MAWCESHSDIWNHWKLDRLQSIIAAELPPGLDMDEQRVYLVGSIHALFHFALDNSWRVGDLTNWGDSGIERAAKWRRKPGALVSALRESGFLDGSIIHGWSERAGVLIKKRVERENVNRAKAGLPPKAMATDTERVTDGARADAERGPTVKDRTEPNHTEPEKGDGPSIEAKALTQRLCELMRVNDANARIPSDLSKWEAEADKLFRIDKRAPGEAGKVLEWSQRSEFWKANILSVGKFREKYPTLLLQMAGRPKNGAPVATNGGQYAGL